MLEVKYIRNELSDALVEPLIAKIFVKDPVWRGRRAPNLPFAPMESSISPLMHHFVKSLFELVVVVPVETITFSGHELRING